jgi:peptidoglycan/LPS O-acetylase OafA/YrhL
VNHRSNNFDALRLAGAFLVVVGHAYHLLGRPQDVPFLLGFPIHSLGVVVFFSISGYLITASWTRGRSLVTYFSGRILRIFPGLIVVVLITIFVIGPLMTHDTTQAYFHDHGTWEYLHNIWLMPRYDLPGVFPHVPYPNAVNGSLWTLPAEFFCYLIVPLTLAWRRDIGAFLIALCLLASLLLQQVPEADSEVIWSTRITDAAQMWAFFAAGALIRIAHERWRGFIRTDVASLLMLGYLVVLAARPTAMPWTAWAALPYVILTVGLASTPVIRRAARYGDFSYGLYLWAFPVQQVLVKIQGPMRASYDIVLVTLVSLALACLSWHFIERPCLNLRQTIRRRVAPKTAATPA